MDGQMKNFTNEVPAPGSSSLSPANQQAFIIVGSVFFVVPLLLVCVFCYLGRKFRRTAFAQAFAAAMPESRPEQVRPSTSLQPPRQLRKISGYQYARCSGMAVVDDDDQANRASISVQGNDNTNINITANAPVLPVASLAELDRGSDRVLSETATASHTSAVMNEAVDEDRCDVTTPVDEIPPQDGNDEKCEQSKEFNSRSSINEQDDKSKSRQSSVGKIENFAAAALPGQPDTSDVGMVGLAVETARAPPGVAPVQVPPDYIIDGTSTRLLAEASIHSTQSEREPSCPGSPVLIGRLHRTQGTSSAWDDTSGCIVCFERRPDAILIECGHSGLCSECADRLWEMERRCPLCRGNFAGVMRIISEDGDTVTVEPFRYHFCEDPPPSAAAAADTTEVSAEGGRDTAEGERTTEESEDPMETNRLPRGSAAAAGQLVILVGDEASAGTGTGVSTAFNDRRTSAVAAAAVAAAADSPSLASATQSVAQASADRHGGSAHGW